MKKEIKILIAALAVPALLSACSASGQSYTITEADKEEFISIIEQQHTLMGTFYSRDFTEYDVTGDGCMDLCTTLTEGSGIVSSCIIVYDAVNHKAYELNGRDASSGTITDYWIDSVRDDGLYVRCAEQSLESTDNNAECRKLLFKDEKLYLK